MSIAPVHLQNRRLAGGTNVGSLKDDLPCKLPAAITTNTADRAEGSEIAEVSSRCANRMPVKNVEEFGPKLETDSFGDPSSFHQPEVLAACRATPHVEDTRAVPNSVGRGLRKCGRVEIKILIRSGPLETATSM